MTNDIIRMAREAGFKVGPSRDGPDDVWGVSANLVRFAELIRAAEREACAEIDFYEVLRSACNKEQAEELAELISSAIRARGTP